MVLLEHRGNVLALESGTGFAKRPPRDKPAGAPVEMDVREHVFQPDRGIFDADDEALDEMTQLQRVAVPRKGSEQQLRRLTERLAWHMCVTTGILDEVRGQRGDVLLAVAKRWHFDANRGQPLVQVGPNAAVFDRRVEIRFRGSNRPNVHFDVQAVILNHGLSIPEQTRKPRLRPSRQLDHMLQEQRPADGLVEPGRSRDPLEGAALDFPASIAYRNAEEISFNII